MNYRTAIERTLARIDGRIDDYHSVKYEDGEPIKRPDADTVEAKVVELEWAKNILTHELACAEHPIAIVQGVTLDLTLLIGQLIKKQPDGLVTINADDTAKKLQDIRDHLADVTR